MWGIRGQRVLVTGATGTVGRAVAELFLRLGASVVVASRRSEEEREEFCAGLRAEVAQPSRELAELGQVAAELPAASPGQLSHISGHSLTREHLERLQLTGVVGVAGTQPVAALASMQDIDIAEMLRVNLQQAMSLTRDAAAAGAIWVTHIASIEGSRPAVGHTHYAASKAGLIMHARAAALELGPAGVRVNTVSPGLVARPGIESDWPEGVGSWLAHAPLGRLVRPADVAGACVFLASPLAAAVTGQDIAVDAGMLATPGW